MAATFPTVGLIVNISSLAVLWVGADRIAAGQMQVGSLVAYISYLLQILIAVVMATFLVSMIPRAAVAADRIIEVLDTESSVRPPEHPVTEVPEHGSARVPRRGVQLRRGRAARALRRVVPGRCRRDHGDHRHPPAPERRRSSTWSPGCSTPPTAVCSSTESTCGELDPDLLWGTDRLRPAAGVPVRWHGRVEPAVRSAGRDRRRAVAGARDRPGMPTFVQAMPDGLDSEIAQGGIERFGWAAAAAVDRPGARRRTRDLRVRRLVLRARPGHRGSPSRRSRPSHHADAAVVVVAQRVSTIRDADQILVLEDGRVVGRGTHDELLVSCRTYSRDRRLADGRGGRSMTDAPRTATPTAPTDPTALPVTKTTTTS